MGTVFFNFVRKVKIILSDYSTIKPSLSTQLPFCPHVVTSRSDTNTAAEVLLIAIV
jgi:hypothetical protein